MTGELSQPGEREPDTGTERAQGFAISPARIAAAGESGSSSSTRTSTADSRAASGPRSSESFRAISPSARTARTSTRVATAACARTSAFASACPVKTRLISACPVRVSA